MEKVSSLSKLDYHSQAHLGGSGAIAASNRRMSVDRYRQMEVNREYLDNSLKCLETRWRAHPVLPSSMQAKEKMYVHISVGRLGVDMEFGNVMKAFSSAPWKNLAMTTVTKFPQSLTVLTEEINARLSGPHCPSRTLTLVWKWSSWRGRGL